ncbi:site-2 protease family protein [Halorientalis marina]|uniref:site-2 protease family protein n=1 Tax=Halorientalis marina TaxID=2931976 RepID=UPI001FF13130|nr:site-2 protease family protein [Halorientalis marina]
MSTPPRSVPSDLPEPDRLTETFHVYDVEVEGENVRYYGEPLAEKESVIESLAPLFRKRGYRVRLNYETGEHVLVATERSTSVDGIPWLNVVLFLATVGTTLFVGAQWYGLPVAADPATVLQAWPFTAAVLAVLGVHELGHYALSRYHDVEATLPYFIPLPNVIGTMGALIRMRDNIPSRKALFDIGVAGPLAGLVAAVAVTAVGVSLPPIETGTAAGTSLFARYELGYPLLIQGVAVALGEPLRYADPSLAVHPVVVGGWVGAFVTFLNLLPVGQLDGAHVVRALVGDHIDRIQTAVPLALFALAGYLFVFEDGRAAPLWILWGVLVLVIGRIQGAKPIDDSPLGPRRKAVAAVTLVLGLLCFSPIPIVLAA